MTVARSHTLPAEQLHYAWDNSLAPALEIEPGDSVTFETWDASGHYYTRYSTVEDARNKPPFRGHALTGPVYVAGAQPGDVLEVAVLEVKPADWGHTVFYPGRGLLPEDFPEHHFRLWDLSDGRQARWSDGMAVPMEPFCGVMGVALSEPGPHSTMPPRHAGGNMDVKQLVAGTTLYLPVQVPGALFSVGDAHAAQGDGEVCITAIEMDSVSTLRFNLRRDFAIQEPQFRTAGPLLSLTNRGPWHATTAAAPDLMVATKQAVRYMIDYLCREHGFGPEDAYMLASVAGDLKISEVVDAPNWLVSMFFPLSIVRGS